MTQLIMLRRDSFTPQSPRLRSSAWLDDNAHIEDTPRHMIHLGEPIRRRSESGILCCFGYRASRPWFYRTISIVCGLPIINIINGCSYIYSFPSCLCMRSTFGACNPRDTAYHCVLKSKVSGEEGRLQAPSRDEYKVRFILGNRISVPYALTAIRLPSLNGIHPFSLAWYWRGQISSPSTLAVVASFALMAYRNVGLVCHVAPTRTLRPPPEARGLDQAPADRLAIRTTSERQQEQLCEVVKTSYYYLGI
ncbi:hypothetical protein GGR56DRAFT_496849 [Xylariaceae sp. FL0804]|nr:hypothetical protein GGR56DRAFT_496849 [Xylariaceae sp. FL0804]